MPTNQNRIFSEADHARVAELWNRYRSLKALRDHARPSNSEGAWIRDAATHQMGLIADELEQLFKGTLLPEVDEGR